MFYFSRGEDLAITSDGVPDLFPTPKPSPTGVPGPTIHKGVDGMNSGNLNMKAVGGTKLLPMLSKTTTDNVLSSAQVLNKNGLSTAGRALQKHASRPGPFGNIKFSHTTGNEQGLNVLNGILNSKSPIIQSAGNGGYRIFDGVTGRGFGLSRNGLFNGFRQLY